MQYSAQCLANTAAAATSTTPAECSHSAPQSAPKTPPVHHTVSSWRPPPPPAPASHQVSTNPATLNPCLFHAQQGLAGREPLAVILDDSSSVWPADRPNLLVIERYMYFPSSRRRLGMAGRSLLEVDRCACCLLWRLGLHFALCAAQPCLHCPLRSVNVECCSHWCCHVWCCTHDGCWSCCCCSDACRVIDCRSVWRPDNGRSSHIVHLPAMPCRPTGTNVPDAVC